MSMVITDAGHAELWGLLCPDCGPDDKDAIALAALDEIRRLHCSQSQHVPLAVGDCVICLFAGSWVDRRIGYVTRLNAWSSDDQFGHEVKILGVGLTILPERNLTRHPSLPRPPHLDDDGCDAPVTVYAGAR